MEIQEKKESVTNGCSTRTLLFVVDAVNGSQDVLDFACELAKGQSADLHLLHVIDPDRSQSSPDAQMGVQVGLEILAQRARSLTRSTVSLLSFGRLEDVIPKRAAKVDASLIVLSLRGSGADRPQKRLVGRLRAECRCPVLAVPHNIFLGGHENSTSIHELLLLAGQICKWDGQSRLGPVLVPNKARSQRPLFGGAKVRKAQGDNTRAGFVPRKAESITKLDAASFDRTGRPRNRRKSIASGSARVYFRPAPSA
jgi:nucleotide-binding universal stress UspA family protein